MSTWLCGQGFTKSAIDCLFTLVVKGRVLMIATVYVDDILLYAEKGSEERRDRFMRALKKAFDTKVTELHVYLSLRIHQNRDGITIEQKNYVNDIVSQAGMHECNKTLRPARLVRAIYYKS